MVNHPETFKAIIFMLALAGGGLQVTGLDRGSLIGFGRASGGVV